MPNSPRSWNPGKSTIRWIFWDVQRNCNGYFNPSVGKLYFFSVSEFEVLFLYRFQVGTQLKFLLNSYELAYKTNISRVLTTRPFRSTFFDWPPLCPRWFFFFISSLRTSSSFSNIIPKFNAQLPMFKSSIFFTTELWKKAHQVWHRKLLIFTNMKH